MIILDKFIDLMEVIRIKMIAFFAEMSLDRFSKDQSCALSAFVLATLLAWRKVG